VRVATGLFGYDRRGILDNTHLRFFTRATLRRTVRAAGFDIIEESATGLPLGAIGAADPKAALKAARRVDAALVRVRPTLFGYQHVLRLVPHAEDAIYVDGQTGSDGHHEATGRATDADGEALDLTTPLGRIRSA
jgi:hypothetical protein